MDPLKNTLEAAISSGKSLDIIYQGGSHPGTLRRIYPLFIKEGILKARDPKTGEHKSFKLELIVLPSLPDTPNPEPPFRTYHTLHDLLLLEQELILKTGLFVVADRFHLRLFTNEKDSIAAAPLFYVTYRKFLKNAQGSDVPGVPAAPVENPRPWVFNGITYNGLQPCGEAFVKALRIYCAK